MTSLPRGSDGFTLLEVLVALVLSALILAGIPSTLRLASASLRQANVALTTDENDRALNLIEQKLSGALPIFQHSQDGLLNIAFHGDAQSISFIAPLLHASDSGLFRYTLSAVPTGDSGSDIVLILQPYRPNTGDQPVVERRLLWRNANLRLRYLAPAADPNGPQWLSTWSAKDNLPKLVSLTVGQPRMPQQDRLVELRLREVN